MSPGSSFFGRGLYAVYAATIFAANPTGFDSAMLGFSCNRLRVCIRAACWSVDKAARNIFGCRGPNEPKRRFIATDSSRQPTYCGHRGPRPRAPQLGRESRPTGVASEGSVSAKGDIPGCFGLESIRDPTTGAETRTFGASCRRRAILKSGAELAKRCRIRVRLLRSSSRDRERCVANCPVQRVGDIAASGHRSARSCR